MTFTHSDTTYTLPDNLRAVPLTQFIQWQQEYGLALSQRRIDAALIADDDARGVAELEIFMDTTAETLAFFSGMSLATIRSEMELSEIVALISASQVGWITVPGKVEVLDTFTWGDVTYHIVNPVIPVSGMTYSDFKALVLVAKYLHQVNVGDWSNFSYLVAVYLQSGDVVTPQFTPSADYVAMMLTVPMDIAVGVYQALNLELGIFTSIINQYADAHATDGGTVPHG